MYTFHSVLYGELVCDLPRAATFTGIYPLQFADCHANPSLHERSPPPRFSDVHDSDSCLCAEREEGFAEGTVADDDTPHKERHFVLACHQMRACLPLASKMPFFPTVIFDK